jgi:2-dehydro-3-deoxyphosphooctonate aldolase (KDO 8-P synthase)
LEIHPDPDKAFSDGPNQWQLSRAEEMLTILKRLDEVAKSVPYLEETL